MNKTAIISAIILIIIIAGVAVYYASKGGGKTTTTSTPSVSATASPTATGATSTPQTSSPASTTAPATTTAAGERNEVCVVYDIGGRGDLSFNDMAYLGASKAAKDFGLKLKEVQSTSESDYLPNLRTLAKSKKCAVIVAVGFLMTDAVKKVADEYPDQLFAIIDGYIPDKPNVLSVLFKEHEGSAIVGALAGMVAHHYKCKAVGVVLGMEIPVLYKFEAGYYWGIRYGEKIYEQHTGEKVQPLRILYTYTGAFNDPARGKTATEAQLANGACIVYNVAGATGLGIFEAVEEAAKKQGRDMGPPFAIGVDSDQDWIKPGFIIASMMKRVDVGVYTAVKRALDYYAGKVTKYGGILELGLAEGGVGMSRLEDLETFLEIGVQAGKIKPEQKQEIYEKVKKMREQIPQWIWDEAYKLQDTLKTNKDLEVYGVKFSDIEKMIPLDSKEIAKLREIFKVG
ncbi:BMP family protein [Pyrofollis japonicus]|nr:BMP family ABC transporter substrate-binding protein [Pyrofollis japonicus]BEP16901.1 BMP family protein [Pyrofollis japonicus]